MGETGCPQTKATTRGCSSPRTAGKVPVRQHSPRKLCVLDVNCTWNVWFYRYEYDSVHLDSVCHRHLDFLCLIGSYEKFASNTMVHVCVWERVKMLGVFFVFFFLWKEKFYCCSYRFGPFLYPCTDKSIQRFKSVPDWLVCEIMSPFMMLRYIPTVSVNLNWKRACGFHCEPFVHSKLQFELSLIIIYGNTFRFKMTFIFFSVMFSVSLQWSTFVTKSGHAHQSNTSAVPSHPSGQRNHSQNVGMKSQ